MESPELTYSLGIGWLDTLHFWSSRAFTGIPKFSLLAWHPGQQRGPS